MLDWVQLSNLGPNHRTPGGGECENEEAGEADHESAGGLLSFWVWELKLSDESEDHETDEHPESTNNQSTSTVHALDNPNTKDG